MKFLNILIVLLFIININAKDIDFDSMIKEANIKNKQVMVFFHMEHCPWCHKMIDISLKDENVINIKKFNFIYIDVDVESSGFIIYKNNKISKRKFARKFNIYFYPSILMFDNGKKVEHIKGYRNKNKFTNIIKYIGSKSYKDIGIKEFIANEDFNSD